MDAVLGWTNDKIDYNICFLIFGMASNAQICMNFYVLSRLNQGQSRLKTGLKTTNSLKSAF